MKGNIAEHLALKWYFCDCLMKKNFQFIFSTAVVPSAIPHYSPINTISEGKPSEAQISLLAGGR